ncbi:MAG: SAM-dependent methyltransferase [Spirochaetia bacterium]|jgi:uroporphyrinogen III methyltransferase/synthase|nr:SAM-dependent methyltransferase [Spirochaetia bacterium]
MMGQVTLLGAGPGDVGLMTVRGAQVLARAEVVIYDFLADPAFLAMANPAADRM